MKGLLLGRTKEKFAVEIGDCFVKVVFYGGRGKIKFAYKPIVGLDNREISATIKNIFQEKKVKASGGILCFPRNRLTIGTLHLPSTDRDEIAQMVEVNAASQVPYPKEEIIADWRMVSQNNEGYADVILVILQKTMVSKYFGILSAAGLEIKDVAVAPETTLNWFLLKHKELAASSAPYILLNLDYDFTDFLLCAGKNVVSSHLIFQGQKGLTSSENSLNDFVGELKQAMGAIPASLLEGRSQEVFICGAANAFEILKATLVLELNSQITEVKTKKTFSDEVSFIPLLGAIRGESKDKLNFDIPEIRIRKEWKRKLRQIVFFSGLLAYLFLVCLGTFSSHVYRRREYLLLLEQKNRLLKDNNKGLEVAFKKIRRVEGLKDPEDNFLYYLDSVSSLVPEGCNITSLVFSKGDRLMIKGEAFRMSDIFDFISRLESSGVFSEVETRQTRKLRGSEENKSEFELICHMKQ